MEEVQDHRYPRQEGSANRDHSKSPIHKVTKEPRGTSKQLKAPVANAYESTIRRTLNINGVHGRASRRNPLLSKLNIAAHLQTDKDHMDEPEGLLEQCSLEHPHTVPADGAVGVEVEGHQEGRSFFIRLVTTNRSWDSVLLTTVPPHTDSLGVSTKTKAGLVTEDDPLPF
ncbi:hypothetical protein NFI96_022076 [Prochilodus magdalenae]|nr:hypothetical protein NFI96_022076 [Prochilodus magdalenae]